MSSQSMLDQARFWEIIKYLVQLDHKKSFDDICQELSITNRQLNSFITFLKEVNYDLEQYSDQEEKLLCPPNEKPKITLEFSIIEWLQFQAHFPALSTLENKPYHEDFVQKLSEIEEQYEAHDLFNPIQTFDQVMEMQSPHVVEGGLIPQNEIVAFLEESILDNQVIRLQWSEKSFTIFPRKIVYLDGELSLVAEGINDKCLLNMNINQISKVYEDDFQWTPLFSKMEVDDFVSSIRAISENEIRLVLKIYNRENFDKELAHQHFGKPCMFTNPEGDFIWAASIEPSPTIHEWLSELGSDIEILDPIEFKKEFLTYCEHKLKKLA